MLGVLVNTLTVIIGSLIGLLFKKAIPKKITDAAMIGIGLCSVYIGISGALKGSNTIVLILATVIGGIIGTLLDIDGGINRLGEKVEKLIGKLGKPQPEEERMGRRAISAPPREKNRLAKGFVSASLLFCVGSMTLVGSFNAGILGDNSMLLTKAVLDFFSAVMLSVSLGIGVLLSAVFVLVFQGILVILSGLIAPVMTSAAIAETVCAGSLLVVGIGLNLIGITKLKVADYLPSMVVAPLLVALIEAVPAFSAFFA